MGRLSRVSFLIAGLVIFPAMLFAQFNNSTSSPYSRYGLGDLHPYSFGRSAAMGGAALASRYQLQINNANPASYTATDSLNFLFDFGIYANFSDFKADDTGLTTGNSSMKTNDVNFSYFAMQFRINRWMATSFGLLPYSDVGYQVEVNQDDENAGAARTIYYGTGTISDAYLGLAIEPFKFLSVGANLNYRFGSLSRNSELTFASADLYLLQRYSRIRISDFGLELGAQATIPLAGERQIVLAAVYEAKPEYTAYESDIVLKNIYYGTVGDQDTLSFKDEEKGKIVFPTSLGLGISFSKRDVYEVNLDYYHQTWSEATFFGQKNEFLTDLNKFAAGVEWIPDRYSIRSGWKRVAYRAGVKYAETYHYIQGQQIDDFGITFGLGLPIYRSNSTINLSAEIGSRGTTSRGLVRENYAKFSLSANLHDLWFMTRKID